MPQESVPVYTPKPIDTTHIKLDADQLAALEPLSRNIHELWAQRRVHEGWRLGPVRDDQKRTHPCLIPYDGLSAAERAYDRVIAEETLKLLLQLGFTVSKT